MSASVSVMLDTRPPMLTIVAEKTVEPPTDWVVEVGADETLGIVSAAIRDSLGVLTNLGYERTTDRTLRIVVPTPGLSAGRATLMLSVADEVLNLTATSTLVSINHPDTFGTDLSIGGSFETDLSIGRAYDVALSIDGAFETDLSIG